MAWHSGRSASCSQRGKSRCAPLLLCAAILLQGAPATAASRSYDPLDEEKLLVPSDADPLGLEEGLSLQYEQGPGPKALQLSPMAMAMLKAPMGREVPELGGMVQVEMVLRRKQFGLLLLPRLRLENVAQPLGKTSVLLQQVFAFYRAAGGEVKLGKVLAQFGRMWDYGVYGPLLANNDAKLTPDLGASFELTQPLAGNIKLEVVGQYFLMDGRALSVRNPSFFSGKYARRRNIAGVRAVPVWRRGDLRLALGLSGQHYATARPTPHQVWRGAADFAAEHPWFNAFVELGRQAGQDISTDNDPISSYNYVWAGVEAKLKPVSLRYHVNVIRYQAPYPGVDVLHQPGAEWTVNGTLSLVVEAALWRTSQAVLSRGEQTLLAVAFIKL